MPRHLVALTTDIVIDFPRGMKLDPELPEVQELLRESFTDFLESSEQITLGFDINPEEEETEKVRDIAEVYYKIHDGKIFMKPAYVFRTDEDVYVDEADWETNEFRLEQNNETGDISILCLSDEDFYISDDVTESFDTERILELCDLYDKEHDVTDLSYDYVEFYLSIDEHGETNAGPLVINISV
jgi:hypothetical protein